MSRQLCNCDGCTIQDCDKCKFCLDKPKFGGQNKLRKRCLMRACNNIARNRSHLSKMSDVSPTTGKEGIEKEVLNVSDAGLQQTPDVKIELVGKSGKKDDNSSVPNDWVQLKFKFNNGDIARSFFCGHCICNFQTIREIEHHVWAHYDLITIREPWEVRISDPQNLDVNKTTSCQCCSMSLLDTLKN